MTPTGIRRPTAAGVLRWRKKREWSGARLGRELARVLGRSDPYNWRTVYGWERGEIAVPDWMGLALRQLETEEADSSVEDGAAESP